MKRRNVPARAAVNASPDVTLSCSYYKEWKDRHVARDMDIKHKKFLEKEKNTYQIEAVRRVKSATGHAIGCENARKYRRKNESSEMEAN